MKIEIYNKKTNEIIETKEISEHRFESFLYYWSVQCDTDNYDWREVE